MLDAKNAKWTPQRGQWVVFRTDTQVVEGCVDVYVLMQCDSDYVFGSIMVQSTLPSRKEVENLFSRARKKCKSLPPKVTFPKGDPAESEFKGVLDTLGIPFETRPASDIGPYAADFKREFGKEFFSPSGATADAVQNASVPEQDREALKSFLPDSYDPCPCASGKKYKFCCKRIFREVVEAMCAAEEGKEKKAIEWISKAEQIAGHCGEILCRWAIVYSFFDKKKCRKYLAQCLKEFPSHPRANYLSGIDLKDEGKYEDAVMAYKNAIKNYPESDRFHLNETWNNLGSVYMEMQRYQDAKDAWEKAVVLLPADKVSKDNLFKCIYMNPTIPNEIQAMSPFMKKYLTKEKA